MWVPLPLTFGVLDYNESPCLSLSGCLITVSPLASHLRGVWLQWVPLPLTFGVLDYSESPCLSLSGCLITVSPLASHFQGAWLQWVPSPLTTYQINITGDVQKRLLQRLGTCAIEAEVLRESVVLRNISLGISVIALRMRFCMSSGVVGSVAKTIPFT